MRGYDILNYNTLRKYLSYQQNIKRYRFNSENRMVKMNEGSHETIEIEFRIHNNCEESSPAQNENNLQSASCLDQNQSTENRRANEAEDLTPERCEEIRIANSIFNHLRMFQYFEDLQKHDKRLMSNYLPLSVTLSDELRITFLKEWNQNQLWGKRSIDDWTLQGDVMTKESFINNYVESIHTEHTNEKVSRCLISSMKVL